MITDEMLDALKKMEHAAKKGEKAVIGKVISMLADFCGDEWKEISDAEKRAFVKRYV